jgi:hypothetical protein
VGRKAVGSYRVPCGPKFKKGKEEDAQFEEGDY